MYNKKSLKAEDFINHEEVLRTLDYAEKNKNNFELIDKILQNFSSLYLKDASLVITFPLFFHGKIWHKYGTNPWHSQEVLDV